MKANVFKTLAIVLTLAVIFSSCGTQFNAQKRRYQDGYNLETVRGGNKKNETVVAKEEKTIAVKPENKTTVASNYEINDAAIDEAFAKADNVTEEVAPVAPQLNSITKKGQNLFATEKKIEQRKNSDYVWQMNSRESDPHSLAMIGFGLGIASIVLGLGCLAGIPGIIISLKAKKAVTNSDDKTFALLGLIFSIIGTVAMTALIILYVVIFASLGAYCVP